MERRGLGIPDPRSRIPLVHRRDKGSATRGSGPLCRWVGHRSRRFHLKVSVRFRWFQSVIMFSQSGMGSDPSWQPCSLQDRKIHTGPPAPRLRWQSIGAARAEHAPVRRRQARTTDSGAGRPSPRLWGGSTIATTRISRWQAGHYKGSECHASGMRSRQLPEGRCAGGGGVFLASRGKTRGKPRVDLRSSRTGAKVDGLGTEWGEFGSVARSPPRLWISVRVRWVRQDS